MVKLCIKCGGEGHTTRNCKNPVTSFGLVVFTSRNEPFIKGRIYPFKQVPCKFHEKVILPGQIPAFPNELLFLLVERKDTVGFLNIVQGSYPDMEPYKQKKLHRYLYELTCEERQKLVSWSFPQLWKIAGSDKRDMKKAQEKFENLGIKEILENFNCWHQEADYLMPKGRLKFGETTRQCAIREFAEETGYKRTDVELLNIQPFEEQFTGTDGKSYRNIFFVAKLKESANIVVKLGEDPHQTKEVRNLGWFNTKECMEVMRDYHQDKKNIILHTVNILANTVKNVQFHPRSLVPPPGLEPTSSTSSYPAPNNRNGGRSPNSNTFMRNVTNVSSSEISN